MPQVKKKKSSVKTEKIIKKTGKKSGASKEGEPRPKKAPASIHSVRGMRDILPLDQLYWGQVRQKAGELAGVYGYERIDTPIIEDTNLFVRGVGKATDIIEKEILTKKWTDWIDYWSVDFDFESKKEIVRVLKTYGDNLFEKGKKQDLFESEEKWTGNYIFENEWQSFRTKKDRTLELTSVFKEAQKGKMKIAIDRKSTRLNSSHTDISRMPSSA